MFWGPGHMTKSVHNDTGITSIEILRHIIQKFSVQCTQLSEKIKEEESKQASSLVIYPVRYIHFFDDRKIRPFVTDCSEIMVEQGFKFFHANRQWYQSSAKIGINGIQWGPLSPFVNGVLIPPVLPTTRSTELNWNLNSFSKPN